MLASKKITGAKTPVNERLPLRRTLNWNLQDKAGVRMNI
jgi:hypothetical protein